MERIGRALVIMIIMAMVSDAQSFAPASASDGTCIYLCDLHAQLIHVTINIHLCHIYICLALMHASHPNPRAAIYTYMRVKLFNACACNYSNKT